MAIKGQRTAAGEATRKEILDAALKLLGRGGPDAFSAGALAREANVSKATIFHHFASVDDILLAAFDWRRSLELEGRATDIGPRSTSTGSDSGCSARPRTIPPC